MITYKSDLGTRVGYVGTKPEFQVKRTHKAPEQVVRQQQNQEGIVETQLPDPKLQFLKNSSEVEDNPVKEVHPSPSKKSFNVYMSCLDMKGDETDPIIVLPDDPEGVTSIIDYFKDDVSIFEGAFGNVIVNKNGLLLYTDISGKKHCEEFDRDGVEKIFPMGISYVGFTKSIWFKDGSTRDDCFDLIKSLPPSYSTVIANPSNFCLTEDADYDKMKVFEGINDTNVVVQAENIVCYADHDHNRQCVKYNEHKIHKCFPNGIYGGGLPRTIWFNEDVERDRCFMLMKWNIEEESVPAQVGVVQPLQQVYAGLYGDVVLYPDSQIEFTSLQGVPMICFYEASEIQEVFPNGISYGGLYKSIWFRDIEERDNCVAAMRMI